MILLVTIIVMHLRSFSSGGTTKFFWTWTYVVKNKRKCQQAVSSKLKAQQRWNQSGSVAFVCHGN